MCACFKQCFLSKSCVKISCVLSQLLFGFAPQAYSSYFWFLLGNLPIVFVRNLSTVKTQNAKRVFRNARSERRGGLQWFLVSEAISLPILCCKAFFKSFSKSSWTSVNSTTIKCVKGQNLFLSEKKGSSKDFSQKRIRSWEAQLFHTPFWALRAHKIFFYLGGKRFQCPGPGNTLTLDYRKKWF